MLRDDSGRWIMGFGLNIGVCSVTAAELWALYHGLELAWAEGLRKISVAVDSTAVMTLISKEPEQFNPNRPLIKACRNYLKRAWECKIEHTYREGNQAADWLANHSHNEPQGLTISRDPPQGSISILNNGVMGVTTPRLCS